MKWRRVDRRPQVSTKGEGQARKGRQAADDARRNRAAGKPRDAEPERDARTMQHLRKLRIDTLRPGAAPGVFTLFSGVADRPYRRLSVLLHCLGQ